MPAPNGHGSRRWGARDCAKFAGDVDCPPEVFELLNEIERERAVQTVKLGVEALLAANKFAEAESVLQRALSADPGSAALLALQQQVTVRLEQAEQIARQREAELLAELEGESAASVEQSEQAKEKARKKKEKKQRQLEAKRRTEAENEAAVRVALGPPEPAAQLSGLESEAMKDGEPAEGQKTKAKKKKRNKNSKKTKKSQPVDLGNIVEPGVAANAALALELKPEQDEVAVLLCQLGLSEHLKRCLENEMDVGAFAPRSSIAPLAPLLCCVYARGLRVGVWLQKHCS